MYNSFFMVVSSNQVLVICQERDSMNVCIRSPPPWFPVSIPFPVNPSVDSTSEPWLVLQNIIASNTGAIQSRVLHVLLILLRRFPARGENLFD